MNNHPDTDSMLEYIHELIKRDCEHYMDETVRSDIQSMDFKRAIIDEKKIGGFKANSIFDWKKHFIFPTVRYEKSWFWLNILTTEQLMEQYYAEQRRILLTDMSNHSKPNLDSVIWWNYPIFSYAVGKLKEYRINGYSDDTDWDLVFAACRVYYLEYGEDMTIWGEALRHFGRNYTEGLKISKWNVSYVTKEMCPNMSDDEIRYMNHMWNNIFNDKPYVSDFNNNKPKNSWLERKTKRGGK